MIIKDILLGVAVGDALGVPVEFLSRSDIKKNPVTDMIGFGTYNLPPGTFSDDSSLAFCLAEALIDDFNIQNIANNFIAWLYDGYWTPYGDVFDIGNVTRASITRLNRGVKPELAGGMELTDNGNGSLMRILPLLTYIKDLPIEDRFKITKDVSSITHGNIRSVISCFYYLEFARQLVEGKDKFDVYQNLKSQVSDYLVSLNISQNEIAQFANLLQLDIDTLSENQIYSDGYVIHTLEASIWCLLTTDTYKDAVLKAVNLGSDTDTTGAVTGGLAALAYGWSSIPEEWINRLARKDDILDLISRSRSSVE